MKSTALRVTPDPTTSAKSKQPRPALKNLPTLKAVRVDDVYIWFDLEDGRQIGIPLAWSERLQQATPAQRQHFTVSAWNVFWDDIDEIIGIENVLYGNKLYLPAF